MQARDRKKQQHKTTSTETARPTNQPPSSTSDPPSYAGSASRLPAHALLEALLAPRLANRVAGDALSPVAGRRREEAKKTRPAAQKLDAKTRKKRKGETSCFSPSNQQELSLRLAGTAPCLSFSSDPQRCQTFRCRLPLPRLLPQRRTTTTTTTTSSSSSSSSRRRITTRAACCRLCLPTMATMMT